MFKKFDSNIYRTLQDIELVKTKDGYNKTILPLLGGIIRSYNLENDIIISLAHRHFDLADNEKMVSNYLTTSHRWVTKPMIKNEQKLIPWNWKLSYDPDNKIYAWYPIDFLLRTEKFKNEARLSNQLFRRVDFMNELAKALIRYNAADVFGLALLMPAFNELTDNLVMFEENNLENRISTSYFIKRGSLNNPDAMTQWHFKNTDLYQNGPGILRWCDHS
jgi:hypothetical protein